MVEFIRHIPAFRENGQFVGTDRYRAVLRAQRPPLREDDFENSVRADLLAQKLQEAVTSWVTVSEQETDAEYRRRNEKVKLDVVGFTADQFRTGLTATDAEAQALYTKDPSRYKFGERRKIRYLTVDTQALRASITPTPQQVEAHYQTNLQQFSNPEQVHAQHILLKTTDKDAAAVRKQAESVLKEAKAPGADFPALARKYSEDEASKGSGGDLGFFGRGSMVKPFEDAAFAMAPGQTSDLVQTDFGFHVIKVLEKRAAGQRPLAEVKDQISRAAQVAAGAGARHRARDGARRPASRRRPTSKPRAARTASRSTTRRSSSAATRCPSSARRRRSPPRRSRCRTARSARASAPATRRCSSRWPARKRRACRSSTR